MDGTDSLKSSLEFCLSFKLGVVSSDDSAVVTDAVLVSFVAIVVRLCKLLKLLEFSRVKFELGLHERRYCGIDFSGY